MKIAKFSTKKTVSAVGQTAAVAGGMLLSNGVSSVLPFDNKTAAKGIVAALGLAGAIFIDGNDMVSKIAQGLSLGMSAQQVKELVKDVAQSSLPANDGSKINEFINAAFENNAVAQTTMRSMGNPNFRFRLANPNQHQPAREFNHEVEPQKIEFSMT